MSKQESGFLFIGGVGAIILGGLCLLGILPGLSVRSPRREQQTTASCPIGTKAMQQLQLKCVEERVSADAIVAA